MEKKDFRKLYEDLVKSDWFKKAYHDKSLGICPFEIPELNESEDERIRKEIVDFIQWAEGCGYIPSRFHQAKRPSEWIDYLEKQKDASKAIEAVDRIDKYIDENVANAHDMKDSNPDKQYYRGWDEALGEMAGILQDVYSGEKKKESLGDFIDDFPYSVKKEQNSAESEDERIRKALIDALKTSKSVGELKFILPEPTREECIAYLEKQKDLTTENIYKHSRERMSFWNGQQKEQKPVDLSEMMVHKEPYIAPVPTPMVADGQKPDWSEEDEKSFNNALSGLKYAYEDLINHKSFDSAEDVKNAFDWLKSLRPQPKQEWSEEDINDVIERLELAYKETKNEMFLEDIMRLKSLRPQPKKELSIEKAIQWLDDTFYFSDNSSGRGRDCEITTHDFDSLEEMYDSFRKAVIVDSEPHWKPTEEQMKALNECGECKRCIKKLYEDLQKRYGTC